MDSGRDLKAVRSLAPDAYTAAAHEGDAVDCLGAKEALAVLDTGVCSATGTVDVKVQESADGSTGWADITGAAFVQVTVANDQAIYQGRIRMTPTRKRYLRAYGTVGTDVADLGVSFILGEAENLPFGSPAFDVHA